MTKLLETAIKKLKQFPKKEQDRFASIVLDEAVWQETFDSSQTQLDQLAKSVRDEIRNGKFKKM